MRIDTDAATITALLEELKEVDFETWKDVKFLLSNFMIWEPRDIPLEQNAYQDIIQGCIQRAIAVHKWGMTLVCHAEWEEGSRHICQIRLPGPFPLDFYGTAYTPAAAILAAYIEAVRAMR